MSETYFQSSIKMFLFFSIFHPFIDAKSNNKELQQDSGPCNLSRILNFPVIIYVY
jgi:hypothetical protein